MADRPPDELPEPRRLRQLRRLVTALTATLIVGVIVVVALLVIRLAPMARPPELPPAITLPAAESVRAVTFGSDWIAVVTADGAGRERVRVIDRATGVARGVMLIEKADRGGDDRK